MYKPPVNLDNAERIALGWEPLIIPNEAASHDAIDAWTSFTSRWKGTRMLSQRFSEDVVQYGPDLQQRHKPAYDALTSSLMSINIPSFLRNLGGSSIEDAELARSVCRVAELRWQGMNASDTIYIAKKLAQKPWSTQRLKHVGAAATLLSAIAKQRCDKGDSGLAQQLQLEMSAMLLGDLDAGSAPMLQQMGLTPANFKPHQMPLLLPIVHLQTYAALVTMGTAALAQEQNLTADWQPAMQVGHAALWLQHTVS